MADLADAPFHHDVALGPEGARAWWLTAADGTRIRLALWPLDGAKGTILMFPGRTEYIEKYGLLARDLAAAGYAMAAIDWRGQGLADRPAHQRDMGYVQSFDEYQQDVVAVTSALAEMPDAPRPWHLLAHSMGGAIGLRALHNGLDVSGVVFSAPMWDIAMSPFGRIAAGVFRWVAGPLGLDKKFVPSTGPAGPMEFDGNRLTNDRAQFDYMENQTNTYPKLALGGPSIRWLVEALRETSTLMEMPAPDRAALTFLGTAEKIVVQSVVQNRMANWPKGEIKIIEGAEHEVLMETPAMRDPVLQRTIAWFDASGA